MTLEETQKNSEHWYNKYKDAEKRITELENKIADIKANCDLAIEGRDIKIKELELELTVEKDQHQEEINLHLHAEEYIKELEKENAELKRDKEGLIFVRNAKAAHICELKDQLTKKADTNHTLVEQMADLESKNAELNDEVRKLKLLVSSLVYEINQIWDINEMNDDLRMCAEKIDREVQLSKMAKDGYIKFTSDKLTKAREIIKKFTEFVNNEIEYDPEHPQEHTDLWNKLCEQAEQFIKEIEK